MRLPKMVISPALVAALLLLGGVSCAVAGVFILAGVGWALIAAAVAMLALAGVMLRGLPHVG